MPVFRTRTAIQLFRDVRAFLNVEGGVTRSQAPVSRPEPGGGRGGRPAGRSGRAGKKGGTSPVPQERLVWIFGSGKTGSTWLSHMMADLEGYRLWAEPDVGKIFGETYERAREGQRASRNFVLGDGEAEVRARAVRNFVLESVRGRFPGAARGETVVIKEPWGSVGAPLLMQALPESRMVLLVRDPRDTVASGLGSTGWNQRNGERGSADPGTGASEALIRNRAEQYLRGMQGAITAYEAHSGPKSRVRYEDLRADTPGNVRRIYSELGLPVDEAELSRVVAKHSWEAIPEEKKGEGKFYRKASTGGWREDLTSEQAGIVEEVAAPVLERFYSA